ncbi:MAG: hypothetical protein AB4911_21190 [Oscillochloridaceae bacterium umkhey_bin13]
MTPARPDARPHQPYPRMAPHGDNPVEAGWPTGFRALLLLTDAVHPGDPALARLSDDDLRRLRATMLRLNGDEPTSVA